MWMVLVVTALFAAGSSAALAQGFEGYFQTLEQAVKAGNFQQVRKLVQTDNTAGERAFFQACDHYVTLSIQGDIEGAKAKEKVMQNLGNAFFILNENSDFTQYTQFLSRLNLLKKEQWSDAYGLYVDFATAYFTAEAEKEPSAEVVQAALDISEAPASALEDLGDYYLQGNTLMFTGVLYSRVDDFAKAKRSLELAKAVFGTFDSERSIALVDERLNQIGQIEKHREAEEHREVERENDKGVVQQGERPFATFKTQYRMAKKGLDPLLHPYAVDEYLMWNRMLLQGTEPKNFTDEYERSVGRFSEYYTQSFNEGPSTNSLLYPFNFVQDDGKVTFDQNDDGRVQKNERLKLASSPKVFEFKELPAKSGGQFNYAVELVDIGQETWFGQKNSTFANEGDKAVAFRRACHLEGDWNGKKVILVDDNSNGAYGDVGADVLYVKGEEPSFFGKIMRLGGELVEARIPDLLGNEFKIRTYEGEVGSVETKWKAGKEQPQYLFIRGVDGDVRDAIFRLDLRNPVEVPVGKYRFYLGFIAKGSGRSQITCEIRRGKSSDFVVKAGETHTMELGSPFQYQFKVKSEGDDYMLRGRDLELYGKSGELYTRFYGEVILPKYQLKKQGGGTVAKGSMRLVEYEDRVNDFDSVWFPKDVLIEGKKVGKNAKFSGKFTASSKLLGSIKSDFVDAK